MDMDMPGMMAMGWWMLLAGAIGIALLTLIVVVIVRLARSDARPGKIGPPPPEDELYQRYARGEISAEDYIAQSRTDPGRTDY